MTAWFKYVSIALLSAAASGLFVHGAAAQTGQPGPAYHEGVVQPTAAVLPFEQLERIAAGEMAHVTELEVRDLLLKAKGFDAQGMKVEVLLDRRDGYVLSRRIKAPKHMQRYAPHPAPNLRVR
ncbi:hypothetical protein B1992_10730 [Pseudoxanthomonas broegbernensis]|uniref:PepSY domain-containing protein n=1 Tax=Pseudoxanthomonas broegbernensis TaxID=83619 RepID=A0A7V8K6U5_9GAMM|nr:hypothetical protein [Pseudoxanthomonas broegbernensis]KAF1685671.1 hypothetical protein B1992_10730 [Pseudoxanthomonas broegbernensis]MBB6066011.1 hypothetical protein [Pseudoxanthomonas broegbernensis]